MLSFTCTVRRWSLHINNIFILRSRNLRSNGSQWSQTYPSMQDLGWELYNRTAWNESTPMKNDKIRYNSVTDYIDTPTQFITFHRRSYTKVHCLGIVSTLQLHFLTLSKLTDSDGQLITMVIIYLNWFSKTIGIWTIYILLQGMKAHMNEKLT